MRWLSVISVLLVIILASAPASAIDIKGNIMYSDGTLTYNNVTLGNTYQDSYMGYYEGSVPGYKGQLLYDPYNRMWVPGPVIYKGTSLDFNGQKQKGWMRKFGNGKKDSRFFFSEDGHVYQRVDSYRSKSDPVFKGVGSKGKGKGKERGRGHDKVKVYSHWVDLADRQHGELNYLMRGQERPTQSEIEMNSRNLSGYDYGNWRDGVLIRPTYMGPMPEEEMLSIGGLTLSIKI